MALNYNQARAEVAPDGSYVVRDAVVRGATYHAVNIGLASILPGYPVVRAHLPSTLPDGTPAPGFTMPHWDFDPGQLMVRMQLSVQSYFPIPWARRGFLGVALEWIEPGGSGEIAGVGSIVAVRTETLIADTDSGLIAVGGNTPLFVELVTAAPAAVNTILGNVLVAPGVGAGRSGTQEYAIILVNPR